MMLYLAITWSTVLVFDIVVFILTLYQALHIGLNHPLTLLHVLLRDGTIPCLTASYVC